MNLSSLLNDASAPEIPLAGLSEHTAEILPGYGFIGVAVDPDVLARHCLAAQNNGAVVVLHDSAEVNELDGVSVPLVRVPGLSVQRGGLAARFYGDPSAAMTCVGVTGTNGKTSVAYHIADLSSRLGAPMGYAGTLGWGGLDDLRDSDMTTPNAVALQRELAALHEQGMAGAALEVSSHALAQDRAADVQFDYAVFTNLTRDHLDYHGTHQAYGAAKTKLFSRWPLRAALINVADPFGAQLVAQTEVPVVSYGTGGDWSWQARPQANGLQIAWDTPQGRFELQLPLVADYAVANVTAAAATMVSMGHAAVAVFEQLPHMRPVPGRMEVVARPGMPRVVVDYAHTPDALGKVLDALRAFCAGRLICLIGCGGDRDVGKRPLMGAAAEQGADVVWLTSDNPRSEAPADIIADMRKGIRTQVHECIDRGQAIREALSQACAQDVVLVAGKGHETCQEIDGQLLPFDDRQVVAEALEELG